MSDVGLNIVIGADVNAAVAGLVKIDEALDVTNLSLDASIKQLDIFYNALNRTTDPTAIKAYETSIESLETHIAELSKGSVAAANSQRELGAAVAEAAAATNAAAEAAANAAAAEIGLAKAGQSAAAAALPGTLTQQRVALTDLGRAATGTGFSVRSLVSNISLLGPVGVVAIGALYFITKALFEQTDAEKKAADAAKELKKNLEDLKSSTDIVGASSGGTEGDIEKVNALANAVRNSNLTYKERQNALDQLKETNKAYFGDLTLEDDKLKTLTGRVNEYSNALIAQAVVKGYTDEISKQTIEYNKQSDTLVGLKTKYEQAQKALADYFKANEANQFSTGGTGLTAEQVTLQNAVAKTGGEFFKFRDGIDTVGISLATLKDKMEAAIDTSLKFKPLTTPPKGPTDNSLEELQKYISDSAKINADAEQKEIISENDKYTKIYNDLVKFHHDTEAATEQHQKNIVDIQNKYTALYNGIVAKALSEEKAKELKAEQDGNLKLQTETEAYLVKSESIGKDATTRAINAENEKYKKLLEAHMLGDGQIEEIERQHQANLKAITDAGQETQDSKQIGINVANFKLNFDQNLASESIKKATNEVLKHISEEKEVGNIQVALKLSANISKAAKEQFQKDAIDEIQQLVVKVSAAAIEGIGTIIGNIASGVKNPFDSVLKTIGGMLGDGLIAIGKQLVEASAIMATIQKAVATLGTTLGPELGLVAGIAAIAAGTILKNAVSNTAAHAFADGGIVTGPTLGLVGEAGPEAIFPLSKLNEFVNNTQGAGGYIPSIKLKGSDMIIAFARAQKNQRIV